jgi:hypothetical protein
MQRALTGSYLLSYIVRYMWGFKQKMIAIGLVLSNFEIHILKKVTFFEILQKVKLYFCQFITVSV